MTDPGRPATRPSWAVHGLLAALVGLALLVAAIVVAAVPAAAGNRVGASTPVMINTVGVSADIGASQRLGKSVLKSGIVVATGVAANSGSRIAANQAAGNAARDRLLAGYPGALPEQSFTTTAGVRRLDILTQGGLGIESKVGRTSLTATTRSQIAKDGLLLRNGDVTGIEWVFSRSGVTGQIGPTGPLADALSKAGIPWRPAP